MKLIDDSLKLEKEIFEKHFMDYQDYCEIKLLSTPNEDGFCYRCNKSLEPMTYLEPDLFYLPCWNCSSKKKIDRESITENIIKNIKDFYYSKVLGDRYFQLFVVDDIYFKTTFPHEYSVFKKVINSLDPPSRNDIWFLDWIPGYPKLISLDNLQGIKTVNLTKLYEVSENKESIVVGDYEIIMPEPIEFDQKRQSRYSLFNKKGDRKRKRIKIGDKCYRLYNTDDDNVKSIFKLTKKGEEVAIRSLTYQDYVIIKLAIMRNKNFMRLIFDIISECYKFIGVYKDTIFLKNTIILDPKKEDICLNLIWTSISKQKNSNYVNISII